MRGRATRTAATPASSAPKPRRGSAGNLTVADGITVPVSVADTDGGILLVMLVDPGEPLDRRPEEVVLESAGSRGVVRLHGRAERVDRGLVRFYVGGDPEVVQRREFVRVLAPQPVTLDDACGHEVATHSLNVSGGGMLLSGPPSLELDDEVRFRLHLSDSEPPVTGVGRVVRAAEDRQRAIVFDYISPDDRERLIHFIFDRQRRALAVTRGDTV